MSVASPAVPSRIRLVAPARARGAFDAVLLRADPMWPAGWRFWQEWPRQGAALVIEAPQAHAAADTLLEALQAGIEQGLKGRPALLSVGGMDPSIGDEPAARVERLDHLTSRPDAASTPASARGLPSPPTSLLAGWHGPADQDDLADEGTRLAVSLLRAEAEGTLARNEALPVLARLLVHIVVGGREAGPMMAAHASVCLAGHPRIGEYKRIFARQAYALLDAGRRISPLSPTAQPLAGFCGQWCGSVAQAGGSVGSAGSAVPAEGAEHRTTLFRRVSRLLAAFLGRFGMGPVEQAYLATLLSRACEAERAHGH